LASGSHKPEFYAVFRQTLVSVNIGYLARYSCTDRPMGVAYFALELYGALTVYRWPYQREQFVIE
jgi:hypothetical protein